MPIERRTSSSLFLGLILLAAAPLAAIETVAPGEPDRSPAVAGACPTFHWTADPAAPGIELVVLRLDDTVDGEPRTVLRRRLPRGASGWTPERELCLDAGGSYAWSVRAIVDENDGSQSEWALARKFEIPVEPTAAEIERAIEILDRYASIRGGPSSPTSPGPGERAPERGLNSASPHRTAAPSFAAPTGTAAIRGYFPGLSGNTYGVLGISDSSVGTGVVGYSSNVSGGTGVAGSCEGGTLCTGVSAFAYSSTGMNFGVFASAGGDGGTGVYGLANRNSGNALGVWGDTPSSAGTGVVGSATAVGGLTRGVAGIVDSNGGTGVYGIATSTTGTNFGMKGQSNSTAGRGVYGLANAASGNAVGVYGETESISATGYGVYGLAPGGSAAYAGYFQGGVSVVGNLTKSSGSFKIDHPLDPERMYLYHSFVESPDMMNVYNGNVRLDEQGEAWIELPDWFEALNRDFRYQLTALGDWTACWVARKVENNRFLIRGGPHAEISWQVTGIRHDPWAERHRIPVEEEKPGEEVGSYLHPAEWNVAPERGLDWRVREPMRQALEEADAPARLR